MTKRSNAVTRKAKWKRKTAPVVMILSQAEKTEPKYFKGFQTANMIIVTRKFTKSLDPEKLKKFVKELILHEGYPIEETWFVLDVEDPANLRFCIQLREQAKLSNIKIVLSNPEFEIWFLMHLSDHASPISKRDLNKELTRLFRDNDWGDYEKNRSGLYDLLKDRQPDAIKRAEKVREHNKTCDRNELDNPSTTVDQLVKHLNDLANSGS